MRRSGSAARATTLALAGAMLALGGALVATAPAHATDFPDVDSETELNAAIVHAVTNPGDPVVVDISGDFSIASGIAPLTDGSLTVHGNGHTISAGSVSAAGFVATGDSSLSIDGVTFDFYESGAVVTALGSSADPANSPTVTISGVVATAGAFDVAFVIQDTAFSLSTTTIHDSESAIEGVFTFGTTSLADVTILDSVDCGATVYLTDDAHLDVEWLAIERSGCTALAIAAVDDATATIAQSRFADNFGGIAVQNLSTGTVEIADSTISGSTGEEQLALFGFSGTTRITNATISGGLDTGFPAISAEVEDGDVVLAHSTVTDNATSISPILYAGGPCGCGGTGAIILDHTVVAGNPGTGVGLPDLVIDTDLDSASSVSRSLIGAVDPTDAVTLALIEDPAGHNLFDVTTPIDPELGPLALNGGSTLNHLPDATSPLINAGDPAFAPPPATDQRGAARISGGIVDIGSVEVQFTPSLVLSRTTTAVGEQVTLTGAGFPASTEFTLVFNSTPVTLGTATSDASGGLAFVFNVPASVSPGAHTVTATLAGNVLASAAIDVTGLPDTGANATPAAAIGALLLLAGVATIAFSRRRRIS